MHQARPRWKTLLTLLLLLGTGACGLNPAEEPLYVLRDSLGRAVAMAGRSQLGDAAPGTPLRAEIGGVEQNVMVGERVGLGPVLSQRTRPAPVEVAAAPPLPVITGALLDTPGPVITSVPLDPPLAEESRTTNRGARAVEAGGNPTARRRGPPPASVSRSVM